MYRFRLQVHEACPEKAWPLLDLRHTCPVNALLLQALLMFGVTGSSGTKPWCMLRRRALEMWSPHALGVSRSKERHSF